MVPEVSVIMPVFDGERYLQEAIGSVLGQSFDRFELIMVDDGSTDRSGMIADEAAAVDPRVVCLHQSNRGVTHARNAGIAASRGELVAFIDQDDRWTPQALALQVKIHTENSHIGYSVAHQICFLQPGSQVPDWFRLQALNEPCLAYLPGTLAIKRQALFQVGLFDPAYPISSDADWFARARDAGIAESVIPQVVLERRIHHRNQSQQARQIHGELLSAIHASILRKRRVLGHDEG